MIKRRTFFFFYYYYDFYRFFVEKSDLIAVKLSNIPQNHIIVVFMNAGMYIYGKRCTGGPVVSQ